MGVFNVLQRTDDEYFEVNSLLIQWNKHNKGKRGKILTEFFSNKSTLEFMQALAEDITDRTRFFVDGSNQQVMYPFNFLREGKGRDIWKCVEQSIGGCQLVYRVKGKNTAKGRIPDKVFVEPLLFIEFALWLNPRFKVQVHRFVRDRLIEFRHLAGDNYKLMTAAMSKLPDVDYSKTARFLRVSVFDKDCGELRQYATVEQLRLIADMEEKIAFAINMGMIRNQEELIDFICKMHQLRMESDGKKNGKKRV